MEELVVSAIETATSEVFATMIGAEISVEGRTEAPEAGPGQRVVSSLKLSGSAIGLAIMSCPAELACMISSQMLQDRYHSVNPEVMDATGEIANMVVGNVKNVLEEKLGSLCLSTPSTKTLSRGLNQGGAVLPPVTVAFLYNGQRFTITVVFADTEEGLPVFPELQECLGQQMR